jgi:hypothetical protein
MLVAQSATDSRRDSVWAAAAALSLSLITAVRGDPGNKSLTAAYWSGGHALGAYSLVPALPLSRCRITFQPRDFFRNNPLDFFLGPRNLLFARSREASRSSFVTFS